MINRTPMEISESAMLDAMSNLDEKDLVTIRQIEQNLMNAMDGKDQLLEVVALYNVVCAKARSAGVPL